MWVEFDIDSDGMFKYKGTRFCWHDWSGFLAWGTDFTAWGGWFFSKDLYFWTQQVFGVDCFDRPVSSVSNWEKPLIPQKIRFWKDH
jgi:hypothetical protein